MPLKENVLLARTLGATIIVFGGVYGFSKVRAFLRDMVEDEDLWKSSRLIHEQGQQFGLAVSNQGKSEE